MTPDDLVDTVPMLGYTMIKDMSPKQLGYLQPIFRLRHRNRRGAGEDRRQEIPEVVRRRRQGGHERYAARPARSPRADGVPSSPAVGGAGLRPHVTIRGLSKRFDKAVIYDNFDLDIPRGELISVFGPNGCGKSTLINMIAGLIPVDAGQILFDGMPLSEIKFGYVFQNYREALFPWLRAFDNIAYPLKLMKVPARPSAARRSRSWSRSSASARPQPLSLSDVGRPAAACLDHARAGRRAGNPVPRRAVLCARL